MTNGKWRMTSPRHIMTVDVEDWYTSSIDLFAEASADHGRAPDPSVVRNTLLCLDLFSRYNSHATFFILTTVAEAYPDLIREIERRGHEIGVHGHQHRLVYNLTPAAFEADLNRSLDILRNLVSQPILGFRAPYWSITRRSLWALEILQRAGLCYDASIFPIYRELYGIPDAPTTPHEILPDFWEFPPATCRFLGVNIPVAGGGYLRMLPHFLLKPLIRRASRTGTLVFYMHPYEIDPTDTQAGQKLTSLKSRLYFLQQMIGRKGNPRKIRSLVSGMSFDSITGAYALETAKPQAAPAWSWSTALAGSFARSGPCEPGQPAEAFPRRGDSVSAFGLQPAKISKSL
jgi:polysaccharide deacetylase family protein (PEP-CTERM system associated)